MSVTNSIITTAVAMPAADFAAAGRVTAFYSGTVTVRSTLMPES